MEVVLDQREPKEILGWFDWEPLYDRAVETAPRGSTLVELGVFCGQSLAYLARRAKESGKGLRIVGVDNFQGSEEFEGKVFFNDRPFSEVPIGALSNLCMSYLHENDVLNDVTLLVTDSAHAAGFFADGSVHMVFIDADHSAEGVTRDVLAWQPKVRAGGILAGHDYWEFPGVKMVIDSMIPEAVTASNRTWWEKAC